MLINIEQLRAIEWGRAHYWDVQFPNNPVPGFDGWIPAVTVNRNVYNTTNKVLHVGTSTFPFPMTSQATGITIEFVDAYQLPMTLWLEQWVKNEIYTGGRGLNYISKIARQIEIRKLDLQKTEIGRWTEWVVPEESSDWKGLSEATPIVGAFKLIVVGTQPAI